MAFHITLAGHKRKAVDLRVPTFRYLLTLGYYLIKYKSIINHYDLKNIISEKSNLDKKKKKTITGHGCQHFKNISKYKCRLILNSKTIYYISLHIYMIYMIYTW